MKRTLMALVLTLGLPLSVVACLWDRDTPADEAKGMPEVIAVLTGRFERNPPLFYEMRLARVQAQLQNHPEDLAAYDDAGVACDRLGRGDEAIVWMNTKRGQLERLDETRPDVKEQRYRYHANLGTFLVHRWVRQGGDRTRIDEVKAARDEIAKALAINPNAHFGREKYQLLALTWIVDPPKVEGSQYLPNLLGWSFGDIYGQETDPKDADDAVRGLAGLVVLGNAWESVDVFHALNIALQRDAVGYERGREGGRNTLAYLAWLRCCELVDAGKNSMLPDSPKGEDLKSLLYRPDFTKPDSLLDPAFVELRAEANAWHTARTAFMTKQLKAGRHPDTDSTFWNGYTEQPAPGLPTKSVPDTFKTWMKSREQLAWTIVIAVPVLGLGLIAGLSAIRSAKVRRRQAEARPREVPSEKLS